MLCFLAQGAMVAANAIAIGGVVADKARLSKAVTA
jgi:hypothetical protein